MKVHGRSLLDYYQVKKPVLEFHIMNDSKEMTLWKRQNYGGKKRSVISRDWEYERDE